MPSKTINQIHFEDLSPNRFEDMCVQVVYRMRNWKNIQHFGRKGSDGGVDIYTEISEDKTTQKWYFQCKRYKTLNFSLLKAIVDDFVTKNKKGIDKYVIMTSADVSRKTYVSFKEYAKINNIEDVEIISGSILETLLYSNHPDLLYTFFGIDLLKKRAGTVVQLKHRLAMKREVEKKFIGDLRKTEILVRDIHRDIYPDQEFNKPGISPWFRTEYYRNYHKGVSLYIGVVGIWIDNNGNWKIEDYKQKLPDGWTEINAFRIGNIPFDNIVDFDFEGDEYYNYPHLYCEFNNLGEPYEKIWYMPTDNYKGIILSEEKMLK